MRLLILNLTVLPRLGESKVRVGLTVRARIAGDVKGMVYNKILPDYSSTPGHSLRRYSNYILLYGDEELLKYHCERDLALRRP